VTPASPESFYESYQENPVTESAPSADGVRLCAHAENEPAALQDDVDARAKQIVAGRRSTIEAPEPCGRGKFCEWLREQRRLHNTTWMEVARALGDGFPVDGVRALQAGTVQPSSTQRRRLKDYFASISSSRGRAAPAPDPEEAAARLVAPAVYS
jgi:hypothetical protein